MEDCATPRCCDPVFSLSPFLSVQGCFFLHLCRDYFVYQYNSFIYSLRISDTQPMYFSHTDLIVLSLIPAASLSTTPSRHHIPFFFMCLNILNSIILKFCLFLYNFTYVCLAYWPLAPPTSQSLLSIFSSTQIILAFISIHFVLCPVGLVANTQLKTVIASLRI